MLPCLLQRVADYCSNPQDLLTRDDLAAFLQSEYGLALDDSHRFIDWLIAGSYLTVRLHRGYASDIAAVVDGEILLAGPAFGRSAGQPAALEPHHVSLGGPP